MYIEYKYTYGEWMIHLSVTKDSNESIHIEYHLSQTLCQVLWQN